ncbi:hypothetical protein CPB97_007530 [Podila verticillata]|nr:hypothetical protein CPB97_007530 [Podila verticillata]
MDNLPAHRQDRFPHRIPDCHSNRVWKQFHIQAADSAIVVIERAIISSAAAVVE